MVRLSIFIRPQSSFWPRAALCATWLWLATALLAPHSLLGQTWTGATSSSFSTSTNWAGDTLPTNDGTANLTFGSSSNPSVTIDASWSVNSLVFASSATSSYSLNSSESTTLTVGSGGISDNTSQGVDFISGLTIVLPAAITYYVGGSNGDLVSSKFSGAGGITKTGTGTLTLGANNSGWTGSLTIDAGTVKFNADSRLGAVPGSATAGMITLNGGTLDATTSMTLSANRGIAVTAASTFEIGGAPYTVTYGGIITGSSALAVTGGTLALSGANTYSGTVTIGSGGTINDNAANALQYATVAATTGNLTFGTSAVTLGALSGSRAIALTTTSNSAVALTVGNNNTTTTYSGALSSSGSLTKIGSGTFTLSGANTYSGATTITGGTLLVSGSLGGSGAVTVNSGATLAGAGSLAGLTTVANGGSISPGNNAVGTLTLNGGLTLNTGSSLNFDLGATSDQIKVTSGVLTGPGTVGGVALNLSNTGSFQAGTYALIDFTGATTSNLAASSFVIDDPIAGYDYSLSVDGSTLDLTATESAVPEPANYAAIAGLAALALGLQRRMRAGRAGTTV